jgi:hypothetical protein
MLGENVVWYIEGAKLVIEIELDIPTRPSKSGKTEVIASTGGNKKLQLAEGRTPVFLGLNCYRYPDKMD